MQCYYNTKWTGIVPYSDQDKGKTHYSALNNWSDAVHYQLCLPRVATIEQPQQSFISAPNHLSLSFPFHSLSQAVQYPLLNTPCLLDWLVESAVQLISFSLLVCVSNSNQFNPVQNTLRLKRTHSHPIPLHYARMEHTTTVLLFFVFLFQVLEIISSLCTESLEWLKFCIFQLHFISVSFWLFWIQVSFR